MCSRFVSSLTTDTLTLHYRLGLGYLKDNKRRCDLKTSFGKSRTSLLRVAVAGLSQRTDVRLLYFLLDKMATEQGEFKSWG